MSRVELCERIRRDHREEGLSIRTLARRHHVHRRTVRQALASALSPHRGWDNDEPGRAEKEGAVDHRWVPPTHRVH